MKLSNILPSLIFGVCLLIVWETLCRLLSVPLYLLPPPYQILLDTINNFGSLFKNAGITFGEALLGFVIANIVALLLAVCMVYIRGIDKAIMPFAIALKTTPIVAMAPLLLLWFGTGIAPKVAAASLICFFPSIVNSLKGFNALEEGEEDIFRIYGATKTQVLLKLRFFRAAPYIFSALKVSSSLSIVGAIVGEFVGANQGIGYVILTASYHLDTIRMFSAIIMTSIMGVAFYSFISFLDLKIVTWQAQIVDDIRLSSPPRRIERRNI
ncbi:ABC-type nitrate/sulfonate/bicarbonate transport system, permease component [Candidatus Magnetobacterium bavaricum]|uniref:ABC-type nitrate/sulfonate/bicarbonate transport system, permease component n=1 Tax=Candidatus Magnetobacterium bavaricum TaxID=29290 RepID=A0A0F3GYF1_9BACT|nr:ABC-type nitrate/sulfonate/bicarbonate transport system, permease component [Candidatus Magnetobacterium bavaricum]